MFSLKAFYLQTFLAFCIILWVASDVGLNCKRVGWKATATHDIIDKILTHLCRSLRLCNIRKTNKYFSKTWCIFKNLMHFFFNSSFFYQFGPINGGNLTCKLGHRLKRFLTTPRDGVVCACALLAVQTSMYLGRKVAILHFILNFKIVVAF